MITNELNIGIVWGQYSTVIWVFSDAFQTISSHVLEWRGDCVTSLKWTKLAHNEVVQRSHKHWTYIDVHVTVHRDRFLIIKPNRCTNFSNLFLEGNSTCFGEFLCQSSGVFHCKHSNGTSHWDVLVISLPLLKSSGHYMYRQFNIQQFYFLPTKCICVFYMHLRTNSDYFPIQL